MFGRLHPRWHSPYGALLLQGILISGALMAALAGSTLNEAFQILLDATFVPLLYLFGAWHVLGRKHADAVPRRIALRACMAASGLAVTVLAIVLALIPPPEAEHPAVFLLKVVFGSTVLIAAGIGQFWVSRRRIR